MTPEEYVLIADNLITWWTQIGIPLTVVLIGIELVHRVYLYFSDKRLDELGELNGENVLPPH